MRILVTGATGFVGSALVARVIRQNQYVIRAVVRRPDMLQNNIDHVIADIDARTDWTDALAGVDVVVHLAARAHVMHDTAANPLDEYRRVNVAGTLNLALQAAAHHVARFVYLSSVKVHGESGVFTENDIPAPSDPYGLSKHEAEVGLREIAADTSMSVVIIRPPLVYGPGVRANFGSLVRAVAAGIPLPFRAVRNQRSLIALDNLVDFILVCIDHPAAANQTFLVSDGEDLSTSELVRRLARAMGRRDRMMPVPPFLLALAARIVGKGGAAQRLLGSLSVDSSKARRQLAWTPPISVDEGLKRAVSRR